MNADQAARSLDSVRLTQITITEQLYLDELPLAILEGVNFKLRISIACNPLSGWIHSNKGER
jgi:hypothetical protein